MLAPISKAKKKAAEKDGPAGSEETATPKTQESQD
jgi:hypothetical protein